MSQCIYIDDDGKVYHSSELTIMPNITGHPDKTPKNPMFFLVAGSFKERTCGECKYSTIANDKCINCKLMSKWEKGT